MLIRRSARPVTGGNQTAGSSSDIDLALAAPFRLCSLEAEPSTLQMHFGGASRTIEPRVMQALVLLASERGRVVSRDRLIELCWGGRTVSEDAINRCIAKVRRIGSVSGAFEMETIPRVGYRLVEKNEALKPSPKLNRRGGWWLVAAALLAIAVAGLLSNWLRLSEAAVPSIAVADFTALNADVDATLYANSVSAALSSALVATGARLAAAEGPIESLEGARRAGAAILIMGTVRRDGQTIRITTAVKSTRTGSTILTKDFGGSTADAGLLPDRVAGALSAIMWNWIALSRTEANPTVTEEILRIYTRWHDGGLKTWSLSRDLARANPDSAEAQAIFALETGYRLSEIPFEQRKIAIAAGREAAKRATKLRPQFSYILPCMLTPPGLLTAACDNALRRAVASDPEPLYASLYFAGQLAHSGRLREAADIMGNEVVESPYDFVRLRYRMFILGLERPDGESELPLLRARAQRYAPDALRGDLGYRSAVSQGNFLAAEAMLDDPLTGQALLAGEGRKIVNSVFHAVRTRKASDAAEARRQCVPRPPAWTPPDVAFGTCLVGLTMLGDLDSVFELANRGYGDPLCCSVAESERRWIERGGLNYPRLELWGAAMAPVRADRRFIEIARRTGMLAYWKSGHHPDFCWFERAPLCDLLRSEATLPRRSVADVSSAPAKT
jgi:DNA-binding winged helix-turn-helix (wHTH) protein/TolB-like protein